MSSWYNCCNSGASNSGIKTASEKSFQRSLLLKKKTVHSCFRKVDRPRTSEKQTVAVPFSAETKYPDEKQCGEGRVRLSSRLSPSCRVVKAAGA